jgi:tRNA-dependent cyclodipeptide synthase
MTSALAITHAASAELQQCRLCISVGSPYFEGKHFASIVEWFNKQTFLVGVVVVLADTLQRHNYSNTDVPASIREQQARDEGDAWLERNGAELQKLRMKVSVLRWDDVRLSARFEPLLQEINSLYVTDAQFRGAVDEDVSSYLKRKARKETLAPNAELISRNYFLEELCCITLMIERFPFPEAYPGPFLKSAIHLASMPHPGSFARMAGHRFIEIRASRGSISLAKGKTQTLEDKAVPQSNENSNKRVG